MENVVCRIIQKSKEGITIRMHGKIRKFTWDDFDAQFEYTDETKRKCRVKDDVMESVNKIDELINFLVVLTRKSIVGTSTLQDMLSIGSITSTLMEDYGMSMLEIKKHVDKKMSILFGTFGGNVGRKEKKHVDRVSDVTYNEETKEPFVDERVTMNNVKGMDELKAKFGIA